MIFFSFASPDFMQTDNMVGILQATAVNGVLAIACTFVIITSGIDLSVGTVDDLLLGDGRCLHDLLGIAALDRASSAASSSAPALRFPLRLMVAKIKIPPFIATPRA